MFSLSVTGLSVVVSAVILMVLNVILGNFEISRFVLSLFGLVLIGSMLAFPLMILGFLTCLGFSAAVSRFRPELWQNAVGFRWFGGASVITVLTPVLGALASGEGSSGLIFFVVILSSATLLATLLAPALLSGTSS